MNTCFTFKFKCVAWILAAAPSPTMHGEGGACAPDNPAQENVYIDAGLWLQLLHDVKRLHVQLLLPDCLLMHHRFM